MQEWLGVRIESSSYPVALVEKFIDKMKINCAFMYIVQCNQI